MTISTLAGAPGAFRLASTLQDWSVGNFKSLDHVTLPIEQLALLAGANSSGKSSILQSLLMVAQSTDDEIILNGTLVRLGEPKDVIRSGQDVMSIGYTVSTSRRDERDREWNFEIVLQDAGQSLVVKEFYAAVDGEQVIEATSARVTTKARLEVNPANNYGDSVLRVRELEGRTAPPRTYLTFRGLHPEAILFRRSTSQLLAALRRDYGDVAVREDPDRGYDLYEELSFWLKSKEAAAELPTQILDRVRSDSGSERVSRRLLFELSKSDLDDILQAYVATLSAEQWIAVPVNRYGARRYLTAFGSPTLGFPRDLSAPLRSLSVATDSLKTLRQRIRYLGPLREEPQVVSATGGRNRNVPAGPKGEYTADLLARAKNTLVTYCDATGRQYEENLPTAINRWTSYLGLGEDVAVEDQGKLGRGLRIRVNGVERDLTTIGVGASQLLPVLTVVLAAEARAIVLLEQPELHLHPAVQSRLADFLLRARPDIQLLVETHSEYLVARLRRRVAEGSVDPADVAILFAEQKAGATDLRRLRLTDLGDLSAWPSGFFDTQEQEARALVRAVNSSLSRRSEPQ